jgi:hypothetical protein
VPACIGFISRKAYHTEVAEMSSLSPCAAPARPLLFPTPSSHLECSPTTYEVLTARVASLLRLAGHMRPGPLREKIVGEGLGLSRALLDITVVLE